MLAQNYSTNCKNVLFLVITVVDVTPISSAKPRLCQLSQLINCQSIDYSVANVDELNEIINFF